MRSIVNPAASRGESARYRGSPVGVITAIYVPRV